MGSEVEHGFFSGRSAFLRQVSDGHPTLQTDLAFISILLAQQDAQQRRFTRPVRSDQSDAIPTIDLQRRVLKKNMPAKRFRHSRDREHREEWKNGRMEG
jgi:hypothetical protein